MKTNVKVDTMYTQKGWTLERKNTTTRLATHANNRRRVLFSARENFNWNKSMKIMIAMAKMKSAYTFIKSSKNLYFLKFTRKKRFVITISLFVITRAFKVLPYIRLKVSA